MKRIYVSHAYGGKKSNKEAITHICQALVKMGVIPISPVHSFSYLNDKVAEERSRALEFCEELVELCDELWLFSEWEKSEGCILERNVALIEMIPIRVVDGWRDGLPIIRGENQPKWLGGKS